MREGTPVDAGIQAWIERAAALQTAAEAPGTTASLSRRRAFALAIADDLAAFGTLPIDERTRIDALSVPTAIGPAQARVYTPGGATGPLPTQLFLHGGGFVFGTVRELVNDAVLSRRAAETGIRFVSLEYALAPEHPYPAARDQAVAAMQHLARDAARLGVDAARLGIGGNSAGASLAASAALVLARDLGAAPHHVALEVPAVSAGALELEDSDDPAIAAQVAEYPGLLETYAPVRDDDAFIADAPSLAGYPPTLVMMAEHDVLRGGGELLVRRLQDAGRPVEAHVMPGHVHGSPGITALSPAAREWQRTIEAALRAAYSTETTDGA